MPSPRPRRASHRGKESFKRAEKELAGIQKIAGCTLMNWTEPEYPQSLLQIYDPPVLLYVRGDPQVLNLPSLSIVGTRRPTLYTTNPQIRCAPRKNVIVRRSTFRFMGHLLLVAAPPRYGTQMAQRLGWELVARGLVIVSGMARGIDAIGHQGVMDANGRAIGVLGTGIDVCYPKKKKELYERVLERGAIISGFPLRTHPAPENFPVRDRIVAGMPLGVVVVEGAQYSGSLITARLAMEFGTEVFGVPGNATQPVNFAPNHLLKQGAKLVTCAADVIEELPTPVRAALVQAEKPEAEQRNLLAAAALNSSEKKLYDLLSSEEPVPIDDLVERSGLNSSEVLATLFALEIKGIVRQLPGKQFSKVLL